MRGTPRYGRTFLTGKNPARDTFTQAGGVDPDFDDLENAEREAVEAIKRYPGQDEKGWPKL